MCHVHGPLFPWHVLALEVASLAARLPPLNSAGASALDFAFFFTQGATHTLSPDWRSPVKISGFCQLTLFALYCFLIRLGDMPHVSVPAGSSEISFLALNFSTSLAALVLVSKTNYTYIYSIRTVRFR